jgi:hypothetical protein
MLVCHNLLLEFPPLMTGEQRLAFFDPQGFPVETGSHYWCLLLTHRFSHNRYVDVGTEPRIYLW